MSIRKRMDSCPVYREPPEGYALSEVEVRLATPQERPLWDALMDKHHYLGFRRLAGARPALRRDLRAPVAGPGGVAEWRLQVRSPRQVDRLEAAAAVPAP